MTYWVYREKILEFLFKNAMTVNELARRAGVSVQVIKNVIDGKKLQIPSIAKIAAVMELKPDDLIVGEV